MTTPTQCRHCSQPLDAESLTLWDGESYCRACVQRESPELYGYARLGGQLEETIDQQDLDVGHALGFHVATLVTTLLLIGAVFGIAAFGLRIQFGSANWRVAVVAGVASLGLVSLPPTLLALRWFLLQHRRLPRTVRIAAGHIEVELPGRRIVEPLTACSWSAGAFPMDPLAPFLMSTRWRQCVTMVLPTVGVTCGSVPEVGQRWQAFLRLARPRPQSKHGALRRLPFYAAGLVAGLFAGAGAGYVVASLTGQPLHMLAFILVGVCEGGFLSMGYVRAAYLCPLPAYRAHSPLPLAAVFAVIGCGLGLLAGPSAAVACGATQAAIGLLMGWLSRRRIRAFWPQLKERFRQPSTPLAATIQDSA